eukprot:6183830-Pleurochrysis_carterae.AAC.4
MCGCFIGAHALTVWTLAHGLRSHSRRRLRSVSARARDRACTRLRASMLMGLCEDLARACMRAQPLAYQEL